MMHLANVKQSRYTHEKNVCFPNDGYIELEDFCNSRTNYTQCYIISDSALSIQIIYIVMCIVMFVCSAQMKCQGQRSVQKSNT